MTIKSRWTPIKFLKVRNKEKIWLMKCSCGTEKSVMYKNYKRGKSLSCGCYNREVVSALSRKKLPYGQVALNQLFIAYRRSSRLRRIKFELTKEQFKTLINETCEYCGCKPSKVYSNSGRFDEIKFNGIDRVNNTTGYIVSNCVSSCTTCNYAKHTLSLQDFRKWIKRLINYNSEEK